MNKILLLCFIVVVLSNELASAGVDNEVASEESNTKSYEYIQEAAKYIRHAGKVDKDIEILYEKQALDYISYLLHLTDHNGDLPEDSRLRIGRLLEQNYVDGAKADLLRACYSIYLEEESHYYDAIAKLSEKYNENSFDHVFGEFLLFYRKILMVRMGDFELGAEKDGVINKFLNKYKPVVSSNEDVYISESGSLVVNFEEVGVGLANTNLLLGEGDRRRNKGSVP